MDKIIKKKFLGSKFDSEKYFESAFKTKSIKT